MLRVKLPYPPRRKKKKEIIAQRRKGLLWRTRTYFTLIKGKRLADFLFPPKDLSALFFFLDSREKKNSLPPRRTFKKSKSRPPRRKSRKGLLSIPLCVSASLRAKKNPPRRTRTYFTLIQGKRPADFLFFPKDLSALFFLFRSA